MHQQLWVGENRTITVCVDSYEDGVLKGQTDCRLKVLVKGPAITYAYNLPAEDLTFSMNSGILSVVITHTDGATQQVLLVLPDWKEVSS